MSEAAAFESHFVRRTRAAAVFAVAVIVGSVALAIDPALRQEKAGAAAHAPIPAGDASAPFVYFPSQFPAPGGEPAAPVETF